MARKKSKHGMGRLYKRDSEGREYKTSAKVHGVFWLEYRVAGKRIREPLTDENDEPITDREKAENARLKKVAPFLAANEREALERIHAKVVSARQAQDKAEDEAATPVPLADVWQTYLAAPGRPDSGPETLIQYHYQFNRFVQWIKKSHADIKTLREITPAIAGEYSVYLESRGISGNTFNKHITFLKMLFRVLKKQNGIGENPFEGIARKKRYIKHSRRELTIEELIRMLNAAQGDLALLLYLGTMTGLRLGDCCTLKWSEVDLHRGIIRRVPNKIAHTQAEPKPVVVGIPRELDKKLREVPRDGEYVLPRFAKIYQMRGRSRITGEIQNHLKNCGLMLYAKGTGEGTGKRAVVEVGFHSLRHTYVSLHAQRGTPAAVVQANVGHSNPAMTAHYTHINEEVARQVAGVLPSFSGEVPSVKPEITDKLPGWAAKVLEGMNAQNWKQVRDKLLLNQMPLDAGR